MVALHAMPRCVNFGVQTPKIHAPHYCSKKVIGCDMFYFRKLIYFSNLIRALFCSLLWFSVAIVVLEVICYLGLVKKM